MAQSWHDLLFAHWPLPAAELRAHIPAELELDVFDGAAWIGVVPFRMTGVRHRYLPALPGFSAFPELNVRTYVKAGDKAGVWFFSLDAANPFAVAAARAWYHLPYFRAQMELRADGESVHYASVRTQRGGAASFIGAYRPTGAVFNAAPDTFEHWLTERYCLYTTNRAGRVLRGEIHHAPWPLQPAQAEIELNTMLQPTGLRLPDRDPVLHFARRLDVVVWPLQAV